MGDFSLGTVNIGPNSIERDSTNYSESQKTWELSELIESLLLLNLGVYSTISNVLKIGVPSTF